MKKTPASISGRFLVSECTHTTNITTVRLPTELAMRDSEIYFKSSTTCCEQMLTLLTNSCNQMNFKQFVDYKRTVQGVSFCHLESGQEMCRSNLTNITHVFVIY